MLRNTVFQGRLGPDINEYAIYSNRKVESSKPLKWPVNLLESSLDEAGREYNERYGTVALLLVRNDTIVWEHYADGYSDASHTNSWSMAKSIISLLIGCAIDDGLIENVDVPISQYFPRFEGSGILLRHLLSMSSGINFDEHYMNPFAYPARALYGDDLKTLTGKYDAAEAPGFYFDYQSGNTQLLAFILEKVCGTTVSDYVSEKLWKPMGATYPAYWSLDKENGTERAFCCFNSNARDFARIGKLVLHQGIWNQDTLISPAYVKAATSAAPISYRNGTPCDVYGFQWWVLNLPEYSGYYARGIQGQYIIVLPDEDLVIVRLGHSRDNIEEKGHIADVFNYIDMARELLN